jgi:hypothetical protein
VAVTLCVPPRPGELCAPIRFLLRQDSTVLELTSRHRITVVEWDTAERAVAVVVEITDPATSRPVDVRFDVHGSAGPSPSQRSRLLGTVHRGDLDEAEEIAVYGTYLGVVADEN